MKKLMIAALAVVAAGAYTVPTPVHAAECNVKKGEKLFKRCKACHKVEAGKNGIGPSLHALIGRDIASVEGFEYSDAMKAHGEANGAWTEELFDEFIAKPKKAVKGTSMSFAGLKKDQQRLDLACYLKEAS